MNGDNAPIIVKKKKVVSGGGHHGGAWKVAYADFVTAMMAFFMLMWLLNATTEKQRKGLADYFSPTIAVNRVSGGGSGSFGGHSVFSENTLPHVGTGASSLHPTEANRARGAVNADQGSDGDESHKEMMQDIEEMLMGSGGESLLDRNDMRHVDLRVTDRGVIVELFDLPGSPLFDGANAPTRLMEALARAVSQTALTVASPIAIEAHTAAAPLVLAQNPVWDKSAARAASVRRLAIESGVSDGRIERTTAHADRSPVVANPMSVRNNRIEIVFLRK
ncbi:MAG: flagellar motor protein MotB [Primorskyibacter sp.]